MSLKAMEWAFRQDCPSSGAKFVLVVLADKADEKHSCFPGQALLAKMTGQGERTVRRQLADLEEAGLIRRVRRHGEGGLRTSDRYVLPIDGDERRPAADDTTGQFGRADLPANDDTLPAKNTGVTGQIGQGTQSNPQKNPKIGARKRSPETEFPEGFTFADVREWTRSGNFNLTADDFEHFRAHHEAKGSKFRDWRKAWQTWAHNSRKFDKPVTAGAAERPDWMNGWM